MRAETQRLSHASRSRAPVTCEQKPMACHMRAQPGTCHMRARPSTGHLSRVQKPVRGILNILLEKPRTSISREMYGCLYVCVCIYCLFFHIDRCLRCFMYISLLLYLVVLQYTSRFLEFEDTRTYCIVCHTSLVYIFLTFAFIQPLHIFNVTHQQHLICTVYYSIITILI